MNRRRFLELLGMTVAAGTVAYSFPSIIVPQNLIVEPEFNYRKLGYNLNGFTYHVNNYSRSWQGIRCSVENGIIRVPSFTVRGEL